MGWVLLLLLLLPPTAFLQICNSEHYGVFQPEHLSAPKGGSIDVSFNFTCPWELAKDPDVRIFWRWKTFHGPFFYNHSSSFIHKGFKNRLSLNWTKGQNFGSLKIWNLWEKDKSTYFCRVQLKTEKEGVKQWQSIDGTTLSITPAATTTTQSPTSKASKTITTGIKVTESKRSPRSQPLSLGATVGVALATAVFVIAILGLMFFLRWKRRKGQPTKAQSPASELFPNTEEQYENVGNIGNRGHNIDLKVNRVVSSSNVDLKEDDIVYASLSLSNSTSPGAAPGHTLHETFPEKALYSVLKA